MKIHSIIYSLVLIALLASCREEIDNQKEVKNIPTTITKVESSVVGTVTDENGAVVIDALVRFQELSTYTDENGVFQFENEKLIAEGTFITIEKEGYFKGSRMFYPEIGNINRVRIELMERLEVAKFPTSSGSEVTFENVKLDFPANGIVQEDGSVYNGNVSVAAKYLDPALPETHRQMPGDLTAINNDDEIVALSSYAMIVVELTGDNGELLQLKDGVPCSARIPVNTSLQHSAPNEIEFWYFDEDHGRWVEEGIAEYQNGFYEVDIPHFTFWNCDVPNSYVDLGITVLNYDGYFSNIEVRITDVLTGTYKSDITDDDGYVNGKVPDNQELLLEVLNNCSEVIHSQTIGPFSAESSITVSTIYDNFITVTGEVTTCADELSDFAYVSIDIDDTSFYLPLDDLDEFSSLVSFCDVASTASARAFDPINGLGSAPITMGVEPVVDFGTIEMCDTLLSEIVSYNYGDVSKLFLEQASTSEEIFTYEITDIEEAGVVIKSLVTITTLDWNTGLTQTFNLVYKYENPDNIIGFNIPESGFDVFGIGQSYIVEQNGENYMVFKGELTDFTITDTDLWDESYNPFTYFIAIKQ